MSESLVPNINMDSLFGDPATSPISPTGLEKTLTKVTPEDAAAVTMEEVKFQFRDTLDAKQLEDLKRNAPKAMEKMITDYNAIIQFGGATLTKMNDTSKALLAAQADIQVPAADKIANDLLRAIDGYEAKARNLQIEDGLNKLKEFFLGIGYSLKTLARESKPIAEKISLAEENLAEMEIKLADNITRSRALHQQTTETLTETTGILAALEEIIEVAKKEFAGIDSLIKDAESKNKNADLVTVEYKNEVITLNELRNIHSYYATGISELEKTWFDWRQQFFLSSTQAPSLLNLALTSATLQRRLYVFRTMGLPQARNSLVMWQNAVLGQKAAKTGEAVGDATNKIIQSSFEATGKAVEDIAKAGQLPLVSEETVLTVMNSIRQQCEGIVAADKWGRDMRAKNLKVLESTEQAVQQNFTESRRQLVKNAVTAVQTPQELAPAMDTDLLKQLGVTN